MYNSAARTLREVTNSRDARAGWQNHIRHNHLGSSGEILVVLCSKLLEDADVDGLTDFVNVIETSTNQLISTLYPSCCWVNTFSWQPNSLQLAVRSSRSGSVIALYDVESSAMQTYPVDAAAGSLFGICFAPGGSQSGIYRYRYSNAASNAFLPPGRDFGIQICDINTGKCKPMLPNNGEAQFFWTHTGENIFMSFTSVATQSTRGVQFLSIKKDSFGHKLSTHLLSPPAPNSTGAYSTHACAVSPDGVFLAQFGKLHQQGIHDGYALRIFRMSSGCLLHTCHRADWPDSYRSDSHLHVDATVQWSDFGKHLFLGVDIIYHLSRSDQSWPRSQKLYVFTF